MGKESGGYGKAKAAHNKIGTVRNRVTRST